MCVGTEEATTSRIRASLVRIFSTLRTRIKIQEENKNYPSSSLDAPSHTVDHNYPLRQTAVLHRIHYANAPSLLGLILFSEDKNCMEEASTMKANCRTLILQAVGHNSQLLQKKIFQVAITFSFSFFLFSFFPFSVWWGGGVDVGFILEERREDLCFH